MKILTFLTLILLYCFPAYSDSMDNISDTILIDEVKKVFVSAEKKAVKNKAVGRAEVKIQNEYSCTHYSKRIGEWLKTRGQRSYLLKPQNLSLNNVTAIMYYWDKILGLGDNVNYKEVNWTWNTKSNKIELQNSLMILSYGIETGNNFFSDFIFVDPVSTVNFDDEILAVTMPLSLLDICENTQFKLLAVKNCKITNLEQIRECDISQAELFIGSLSSLKNKLNKPKKKRSRYDDGVGGKK